MRVVFIYAILFILISVCQNSFTTENISTQNSPLTLDEHNEITNAITNIYNFIEKTKNNQEKIKFLKSLSANNHKDSFLCKSCLWFFGHMHSFLMKKYGVKATFYLLTLVCSLGMSKNVCNEYLNLYGPVIYDSIVDHYINGEYVCSLTRVCKDEHFIKLNADDYAKDLLKDKPLNVTTPFIDIQAPTWKVLQVADLHVDYLYLEGSKAKCSDPLCCRITDKTISSTERAGKWGCIGKCDLPLKTLELFTDYVNEEIKPDFILWTGDNPPHDPWTGSQEAAFNATQTFVDLISKNNNYSLPVYPTPGNHEMYPNDEYNPYDDSDKFLFDRLAKIFKPWLSDEAYETFSKYGYYSQLHPNSNLRIVSTNCLLCDSINFNLIKNPTDPKDELKWLENTLRQSEQAGEVVYLIRHIPIGDGFFLDECAKRHLAIIDRFSHIIRGQFYGHTHYDEVKISRNYFNKDIISGVMFIAPSLTT
jgi:sphingomyelin phosphodiesterase